MARLRSSRRAWALALVVEVCALRTDVDGASEVVDDGDELHVDGFAALGVAHRQYVYLFHLAGQ